MYDAYTNYIKSFINSDITTWNFKTNGYYTEILEHVTKQYGDGYLVEISTRFEEFYNTHKQLLVELCKMNDSCGSPAKHDFDNFSSCSPSNLRYILHSLLILTFMKECNLTDVDVIEIGGGYGGLCFFLHKLSHLFNININSYSMFDLQEPLLLQKKYLENLNIKNVSCMFTDNDIQNIKQNSFLVSNYAYSEISTELQKIYTEKILNPHTSHGFLVWNHFTPLYNFVDNKVITKEEEYPLTYGGNLFVRFKP
jgi:hypothetical protein